MKQTYLFLISFTLVSVLLLEQVVPTEGAKVQYQYKKYTFKKKRDEKIYKTLKQPCEVNPDCLQHRGVVQSICIRKCISDVCYKELYGHDELEEGEIDVRLNSFKGCVAQQRK